MAENSSDI